MKGFRLNSLLVQTVLLMTLALFPLGAVAIFQTNRVAIEAERNAERALLAVTSRAAKTEELIIQRAIGAAQFFAAIADQFAENPEICASRLGDFVDENSAFSFIGVLPTTGRMTCTSTGDSFDFSNWPDFDEAMSAQKRTIVVNRSAPMSNRSVFVLSEPFEIDGSFAGFISVSIPHDGLPDDTEELSDLGLQELMTFDSSGEIMTARGDLDEAAQELPSDRNLSELFGATMTAFRSTNMQGVPRTYTITPIQGSPISVIGVWRASDGLASPVVASVQPALFPILMWIASMSVAMLSIYTLVQRHIIRLRTDMDIFAESRTVAPERPTVGMPAEFRALNENFRNMADDIVQDEARAEDALREKNVLIKEVHHRVKNNLQLISSIMNMQIREAEHDETKTVLSRLQDRIISLATIHRDLYQSQHGGRVDAGGLVRDIVEKTVEVAVSSSDAIDVDADIDPVLLYPDQAVPLSLLVAEGMTNVMKYLGADGDTKPWLKVALKEDDDHCRLSLENSVGARKAAEGTGLGAQLIHAFGIQLGSKIDIIETAGSYKMSIAFKIADFVPEPLDY